MVPPDSDRAPPTPPYSGFRPGWQGLRVRGCHPLRRAFPGAFRYPRFFLLACPTTPRAPRRPRFGLAPFRSPLLGGSLLFSFPPTTGMFRFVGFASIIDGCRASARRVAPFGCPRIHGCSRLPAAFRGLPRPSSPPGATGIPRAPSLARSPPRLPARGPLASGHGPTARARARAYSSFFFVSRCSCVSRVPAPPLASRRDGGCASLVFPSLSHPVNEPSRPPGPLLWRMWGSNPRPPACKAGALAD